MNMNMNIKKKKITVLLSVLLVVAVIAIGITSAVLMKNLEQRANNFTYGNVKMDLNEDEWDKTPPEDKIVYSDREVNKDPKITNTGENDLYAYMEISIPRANVKTVNADETINVAAWNNLLSFVAKPGWEMIERTVTDDGKLTVELYAYVAKVLKPGESTDTLFDKARYLNILEGELPMGEILKMPISSYAIQSEYLDETGATIKDKMVDAYSKYKLEIQK